MANCKSIQDDVASLESWATFFLQPAEQLQAEIQANVLSHALALTNDVRKARKLWNQEEYFQFGAELGTMLVIATSS